MTRQAPKDSKAKVPRARRRGAAKGDEMNQATTRDFEREDMGIAPKE